MCAYLLGIVRSATSLDALTYEAPPAVDAPWNIAHTCVLRPLASRSPLWSAWIALAAVTAWDTTTLGHVLEILRATVPCMDAPDDLAALEVHVHEKPRATAAHPRGFRGTKVQPPRPRQMPAIDLRPYLLTRRHIDQVLHVLGHPAAAARDSSPAFDPAFVMQLLPMLRGRDDIGAFAGLARAMELHVRPELRAALVGVFVVESSHALDWWSYVMAHAPSDQLGVAQRVSASGVAKLPVIASDLADAIARLEAVQQWAVYRGLVVGASPAYLFSGLALGALEAKRDDLQPGRLDVTALIEATVARLDEDSGRAFWRGQLWWLCGAQPELVDVLASTAFAALSPPAAASLIRIANAPSWDRETCVAEWRILAPLLWRLLAWATSVPAAYQRKLIEDLSDVYWWAYPGVHDPGDTLTKCVDLCVRVATQPFATAAVLGGVIPVLALILHDQDQSAARETLRTAPEASWRALEDTCGRGNRRGLVRRGLNRLGPAMPALVATTFATHPSALIHTAEVLAGLSYEAAIAVVERVAASPLGDPALESASIERLCEVVGAQTGGPNPVRRALRRHLAGEVVLSEAQLRGHRERIVADLGILRLAAIRREVDRALAARVGLATVETASARHALAMIEAADDNRRQFRRLLAAAMTGDREWRLRHPLTRAWFARHPRIDRALWLAGITHRAELAGLGTVWLATETDPLEAVKLGTYVGSCLGQGGGFADSAAAVVLDANKQVVYARDATGAVIGRQLLAISEADELVCFDIYGTAKRELLEPAFRAFDRTLATALGLDICAGKYEIAMILSNYFYDDGALTADHA